MEILGVFVRLGKTFIGIVSDTNNELMVKTEAKVSLVDINFETVYMAVGGLLI